MRGVYTLEVSLATVSAAQTLLHIAVPTNMCIEILSATITNVDNDSSEQLSGSLDRQLSGSPTGSPVTEADITKSEAADPMTVIIGLSNLTGEPAYDAMGWGHEGFNNLAGYRYVPLPEERPTIRGGASVGLRLRSTPATTFNALATITYRELG